MKPLSQGPSRLLALGALYPRQSIIGFNLRLGAPFPSFYNRGRQDWPRTAGLAADYRARSPSAVIEVASYFSTGEEIVEVVV